MTANRSIENPAVEIHMAYEFVYDGPHVLGQT